MKGLLRTRPVHVVTCCAMRRNSWRAPHQVVPFHEWYIIFLDVLHSFIYQLPTTEYATVDVLKSGLWMLMDVGLILCRGDEPNMMNGLDMRYDARAKGKWMCGTWTMIHGWMRWKMEMQCNIYNMRNVRGEGLNDSEHYEMRNIKVKGLNEC